MVAVSNRALILRYGAGIGRAVAVTAAAASLLATVAFALGLLRVRPWIYGEAEVLFEASRIREHLQLYVDPVAGAFDYGPVPTRCTVVYPPLWSWALSHVPAPATATVARAICTLAWFGSLAWMAARARDRCRPAARLAATVVAGIFVLALFATSGRPDAVATAIAGVSLTRASRRERVDALDGALLALAAWIKPNVLGIAAGLGLFAVRRGARAAMALAAGALAVTVPIALTLQRVSGGTWWEHLTASLGQPLSLDVWWSQVGTRAMFLAPVVWTTWVGAHDRTPGARAALVAWIASLVWALVSLAKAGSASNYWMEPAIAAVAVFANASPATPTATGRARFWMAAAVASVWLAGASIGGVLESFEKEPRRAALLARARADCGARDGEVVIADNPGGELALNGRVIAPVFQMIFLVRSGRVPLATWLADVGRPEVACVLQEAVGAFHAIPEVGHVLDLRMVEVERVEDWRLYARRDRPKREPSAASP
jgi:hypothetical protein